MTYLRFYYGVRSYTLYLTLDLPIVLSSLMLFFFSTLFLQNLKKSSERWLPIILILQFLNIGLLAIYLAEHLSKSNAGGGFFLAIIGITVWGIDVVTSATYLLPFFNFFIIFIFTLPLFVALYFFDKNLPFIPFFIFFIFVGISLLKSKSKLVKFMKRIDVLEKLNDFNYKKNKMKEENFELLQKINIITSASNFGFFFEDIENKTLVATEKLMSISNLPNLTDPVEADKIFAERIHPAYREDTLNKIKLFYSGKIETLSETFKFYRTPSEVIWLNLYLMVEKRNELTNEPIRVIGYHHDITDQKEIELKLTQSAKLESIGLMASGIAHEINNPLTIISASNQRIKKKNAKSSIDEIHQVEIEKDIKKIEDTVKRISTIIQGLTSFSRNSSADPFEFVLVEKLIEDISNFTQSRLKFSETQLLIEGDFFNKEIFCQKIALSQVLINLINNSIDAIEALEVKWIKIKFNFEESVMSIHVIDSGKGISQKIQENIMSPFFTTKEAGKGTGLGLSICSSIIKNHNGKFFLEPNTVNTTFTIELPYKSN